MQQIDLIIINPRGTYSFQTAASTKPNRDSPTNALSHPPTQTLTLLHQHPLCARRSIEIRTQLPSTQPRAPHIQAIKSHGCTLTRAQPPRRGASQRNRWAPFGGTSLGAGCHPFIMLFTLHLLCAQRSLEPKSEMRSTLEPISSTALSSRRFAHTARLYIVYI